MSENLNSKDYADYFNQLEQSLTKNDDNDSKTNNSDTIKEKTESKSRDYFIRRRRRFIMTLTSVALSFVIIICTVLIFTAKDKAEAKTDTKVNNQAVTDSAKEKIVYPFENSSTKTISSEADSQHVIIMKADDHSIIAMKNPYERAYPASTTKIMTLLTAIDYIEDYNDTFTMTYEITDPLFEAGATVAGFSAGEVIGIKDMLYGMILPSGGDACIGIAIKLAGSEEAFAELMNKKADKMGLKDTNFTNCTGLYDANHYTTAADMAVILSEAMKNTLCRKIMSTYKYTATPTTQHPDGLEFTSTLFSYMYGTEPEGADIIGGKTGFVNESGYCIASYGHSDSGEEFITVTLKASSRWPAFDDQINLYTTYVGEKSTTETT